MAAEATTQICLHCTHSFIGKYCPQCGEKVYRESDKKVWHLAEEGFHFITHFEGTFFTTLRYLFSRPGKVSELYCSGIRKSLYRPISLFFLLIILYLLFPVFEGLNMRLQYHLVHNIYGAHATQTAANIMEQRHWNDVQMADAFYVKSQKFSKFLLLLLLPLTAFYFWSLTFKKRKYFFDQMIFATEVSCMYLIWGFMILPLLLTIVQWVSEAISGQYLSFNDDSISLILYLPLLVFVAIGIKRFYKMRWWKAIGIALIFFFAHQIIVQWIYKFILFNAVIWSL